MRVPFHISLWVSRVEKPLLRQSPCVATSPLYEPPVDFSALPSWTLSCGETTRLSDSLLTAPLLLQAALTRLTAGCFGRVAMAEPVNVVSCKKKKQQTNRSLVGQTDNLVNSQEMCFCGYWPPNPRHKPKQSLTGDEDFATGVGVSSTITPL